MRYNQRTAIFPLGRLLTVNISLCLFCLLSLPPSFSPLTLYVCVSVCVYVHVYICIIYIHTHIHLNHIHIYCISIIISLFLTIWEQLKTAFPITPKYFKLSKNRGILLHNHVQTFNLGNRKWHHTSVQHTDPIQFCKLSQQWLSFSFWSRMASRNSLNLVIMSL